MRDPQRSLGWLALTFAFLALVGTGGAAAQPADGNVPATKRQQQAKQPSLDPLLDRFPIGTGRVRAADPSAQGAGTQESDSSGTSGLFLALLALWTGAIALLGAFGFRALHRWRKGDGSGPATSVVPASASSQQTSTQATERSLRVAEPAKERDVRQTETQTTEVRAGAETGAPGGSHDGDYDDVGRGVAGILEAAEVAADKIRAEAVDVAAGIRKAAEVEAKARIATAEQEAAKVRSDAETSVKEAQSAAATELTARREAAEGQVQSILADAQAQALAIQGAAEEKARQIHEAALKRQEELRAQVKPLEDNLRRALETFGGMGGQLEGLLADLAGRADLSLVDDLNESARTAEARAEGGTNR